MNSCQLLFVSLLTAVSGSSVLWSVNITGEGYWTASISNGSLLAGTFGLHDCRTDIFDIASGKLTSSINGVCQSGTWKNDVGTIGFHFPALEIKYNVFGGAQWSHSIGKGYYFAIGESPVVLREGQMFVWGSNFDASSGAPQSSCMYRISGKTGSMVKGPCLTKYGDGEMAEVRGVHDGI